MEKPPELSRFDDPQLVAQFREDFALLIEEMITDPKHSHNMLMVAVGRNYRLLPDRIRTGERFHIDTWSGDAFATLLNKYRPIGPEYDKLRGIFFVD